MGEILLEFPAEMTPYLADESRAVPDGSPSAVVLAETTADVSAALSWANVNGVPVSVRGAGTGLSGGAVAYRGGLVLSLASMNRIVSFTPGNRVGAYDLSAELGVAGQMDHPRLHEAYLQVIKACQMSGKSVGIGGLGGRPDLIRKYLDLGAGYVATGNDISFLSGAAAQKRQQFE